MRDAIVAVLVCACGAEPQTASTTEAIYGTPGCVLVDSTGMNDSTHDSLAQIQAAINTATALGPGVPHAICIPPGEFFVGRNGSHIPSFDLAGITDLSIFGAGPASSITMYEASPNGHCVTQDKTGATNDWYLFWAHNGSGIRFANLTLQSKGIEIYDEHTYLLEVGDETNAVGTDDVVVQNVNLAQSCGDDIYMIGGASSATTTGVRVLDSHITGAVRAGITIKHGVSLGAIIGNYFESNHDESIIFDVNAACGDMCPTVMASDFVVAHNIIVTDPTKAATTGGPEILVNGNANMAFHKNSVIADNVLIGGAIWGSEIQNVSFRRNLIFGPSAAGATSDLRVYRSTDGVEIVGNTVIRASSAPFQAILVEPADEHPGRTLVRGNSVFQPAFTYPANNPIAGITVWDAQDLEISQNLIVSAGAANGSTNSAFGIDTQARLSNVASARILDNVIVGTAGLEAAVSSATITGKNINSLTIRGNIATGIKNGVEFLRNNCTVGGYTTVPLIASNSFEGLTGSDVACLGVVGQAYMIGGNRGGPQQFVGDGIPTLAAPDGSMYLRRNGGANTTLYTRENATWVAH